MSSDDSAQRCGQTVWGGRSHDREAGLAWDWVQLMPGVVAIADPMSVITNLCFVAADGTVLTAWQAARHLNEIVHGLPWQREVDRALLGRSQPQQQQPPRVPAQRSLRSH